jgi:hypothetical protein
MFLKLLAVLALSSVSLFANTCTDSAPGPQTFNVAASWTSCGGTYPQPTDTWTITQSIMTVPSNITTVSGEINGASAQLRLAAGVTMTFTTTSNAGINAQQGCSTISGQCTSQTMIDTSAAGPGTEVSFVDTSLTTLAVIYSVGGTSDLQLFHTIINAGSSGGIALQVSGNSVLSVQNSHLIGGAPQIEVSAVPTLHIDYNLFDGGSGQGLYIWSTGPTTACSITNNHETGSVDTTGQYWMVAAGSNVTNCLPTGNTQYSLTNHAGLASLGSTYTYNILYSTTADESGASYYGISASGGTSGAHTTVAYNVVQGFQENYGYIVDSYVDNHDNLCIFPASMGAQQGCYFPDAGQYITFTRNIALFDPLPSGPPTGNMCFFLIGNGAEVSGSVTMLNNSCLLPVDNSMASTAGVTWSDGGAGPNGGVQPPSWMVGNVVTGGGPNNISNYNPTQNTFSQGPGCITNVALCYNITWDFRPGSSSYSPLTANSSTDWDDTVHPHPDFVYYGDQYRNPFPFYPPNQTQTLANVDRFLGGPGTLVHLFAQFGSRWNGTNDPRYTPQNVYNIMRAATAPTDVSFATIGPSGGLAGATLPVNIQAVVLVP